MRLVVELAPASRRCVTVQSLASYSRKSDPAPSALTFVLAPLPNALFSHCGSDEFSSLEDGSGPLDLGRFITSIVVVTGFALPLVLAHSDIIRPGACAMSIIGGGCVFPSPSFRSHPFTRRALCAYHIHLGWSMVRSLRTRPRLSRMSLSLTKEVTSFVCAAPCNSNATNLADFYFLLLVNPVAVLAKSVLCRTPCTLASQRFVPDEMFECSVRSRYRTEWII